VVRQEWFVFVAIALAAAALGAAIALESLPSGGIVKIPPRKHDHFVLASVFCSRRLPNFFALLPAGVNVAVVLWDSLLGSGLICERDSSHGIPGAVFSTSE